MQKSPETPEVPATSTSTEGPPSSLGPLQLSASRLDTSLRPPSPSPGSQTPMSHMSHHREGSSHSTSSQGSSVPERIVDERDDSMLTRSSESTKSGESSKSLDSSKEKKSSEKKKKSSAWYNVLNPSYKVRHEEFKKLFQEVPDSERLVVDYSCALQRDLLVHGRLYISMNYICFHAAIFRWETAVVIKCKNVTAVTKEKTALVIPNAIQVCTETDKYFFTSFTSRDKAYMMLFRIWQNALLDQPMPPQELWHWVHHSYGEDLGLTSDDEDYVPPIGYDDDKSNTSHDTKSSDRKSTKSTGSDKKIPHRRLPIQDKKSKHPSDSPIGDVLDSSPEVRDQSLSVIKNGDIALTSTPIEPTSPDISDVSENEDDFPDGEVLCFCNKHEGKETMNTILPVHVDQVFAILFSCSKFFHEFHAQRKGTDENKGEDNQEIELTMSEWGPHASGNKIREVSYNFWVSLPMGTKLAHNTENQTLNQASIPGQYYVVDIDVMSQGLPYCDSFFTNHRYCLTRVSSHETRVRTHSQVKYIKSVWGLVKTFIDKNAMVRTVEALRDLETALQKESDRINMQSNGRKGGIRRTKLEIKDFESQIPAAIKEIPIGAASIIPPIASAGSFAKYETIPGSKHPEKLHRYMFYALLILLCVNGYLYYKLLALEDQTSRLGYPSNLPDFDLLKKHLSADDWIELIRKQESVHNKETERWRTSLLETIRILKQAEESLTELQISVRPYRQANFADLNHKNSHSKPPTVTTAGKTHMHDDSG